jgi:hypothetical protein
MKFSMTGQGNTYICLTLVIYYIIFYIQLFCILCSNDILIVRIYIYIHIQCTRNTEISYFVKVGYKVRDKTQTIVEENTTRNTTYCTTQTPLSSER